jgi:NADPH:quinone reductase-like Zn-dependent oxidoreductase
MKAAVYWAYGSPDVLNIEEIDKPVPADNEVLVRIMASTVCAADWRLRKPEPFFVGWFMNGFLKPQKTHVLGMEFAGTVDSIGSRVSRFQVGDRVFGLSWRYGAHAEYSLRSEEGSITKMPENATFEEAASIPFGAISALYFLKEAGIKAEQKVLIYGASGSVGTAAVQIAKHFGAHVTAVCSTANLGLVKSLGADEVIDYTKDDFSQRGPVFDIIYDTVGKGGFWQSMRALKRPGIKIEAGPGLESVLGGVWAKLTGIGKVIGGVAKGGVPALEFLKELFEKGELRAVIDRRFPLSEIVEAHRYAESGHKRGNVVITIAPA